MHITWNGTDWSDWRRVSPAVIGQPDCVVVSAAELRCYVINDSGRFTQWILNDATWVEGPGPRHPERDFVPFRGDVDCAANAAAVKVVCAWNSVFLGSPIVIAAKLESSVWTDFQPIWLGPADRLSCTASATFPTQFICGFAPPGGGAFRGLHWTGETVRPEAGAPMADWRSIDFAEIVKTDF